MSAVGTKRPMPNGNGSSCETRTSEVDVRNCIFALETRPSALGHFRSFRFPPVSVIRGGARPPGTSSKVGLLRQDQGVIDLNTEIADRAFELRVAEEQLAR
jgi:hypothetical protein